MRHFRYTHKRHNTDGEIILYETGTLAGHTDKTVKLTTVKRFGLEAWHTWTCLADGSYQRIQTLSQSDYKGVFTLKPIADIEA